ncbi:MAG: poly-gamma-glutamate hydrolase family protein [Desulfobacterales bacterium]
MDKYTNIAELKQNEREDEDYTILYRELPSKIAIMAPHGGGIEPGTIDIADNLAGCDYTFYAFIVVSSISGNFAFVDWVEPTPGFVGFRCTQPNLHVAGIIAKCKTQQRPFTEPINFHP